MSTVTTQEARALRNADSICFDHKADGTGQIRAIRRAVNSAFGFEETVVVGIDLSRVNNYGPGDGPWAGFAMSHSVKFDALVQTLVRHIKAGSEVAFVWTRDNHSPVTREAGLYVDMLDVKVRNGKHTDTFRVSTFVGLDNSARMIRVAS